MMQFLFFLIGCVALPTSVWANDRALLIGISNYQHVNKLMGPHYDLLSMQDLLQSSLGFQAGDIKTLEDSQATKAGILETLDSWLVQGTQAGDRVVFYYSGHGEQLPDDSSDEADGYDEALIAYDADENYQNWVLDDEINQRLASIKDRTVLAVFDSCHSGTVTRGISDRSLFKVPNWGSAKRSLKSGFNPVHQREGGFVDDAPHIVAFFAVSPDQEAVDDQKSDPSRPHGLFTDAFAKGVKGAADSNHDGVTSFAEVQAFNQLETDKFCHQFKRYCPPKNLTPMLQIKEVSLGEDIRYFGRSSFQAKPQQAISVDPVGNVLVQSNDARMTLRMTPESPVKLGSTMQFSIESPKAGKLVLFDVNSRQEITQLFPNEFQSGSGLASCRKTDASQWIKANSRIVVPDKACMPFEFQAQEPLGKGKLVAVLIDDKGVDTHDLITSTKSSFDAMTDGEAWLNRLSARLDAVVHDTDGINRRSHWSMSVIDYEIVP